jgi:hypothetical protein
VDGLHGAPGLAVPGLQQVQKGIFVEGDVQRLALADKNLEEELLIRTGDFHLDLNTAQEGVINELGGVEVGAEDDEQLEGRDDGLPGIEAQEIDLALQGDDPAVEQVSRQDMLPTEIVEQEHTAVEF